MGLASAAAFPLWSIYGAFASEAGTCAVAMETAASMEKGRGLQGSRKGPGGGDSPSSGLTLWVCFVVNEWMKMKLFVPGKTVALPSSERSTPTGMHLQCSTQGYRLGKVVFSMVLLMVPLACGKGSLSPPHCSPGQPAGSSVHGILRARTLEWVAMPSSRGSSPPRNRTSVFCAAGRFFTVWATRNLR